MSEITIKVKSVEVRVLRHALDDTEMGVSGYFEVKFPNGDTISAGGRWGIFGDVYEVVLVNGALFAREAGSECEYVIDCYLISTSAIARAIFDATKEPERETIVAPAPVPKIPCGHSLNLAVAGQSGVVHCGVCGVPLRDISREDVVRASDRDASEDDEEDRGEDEAEEPERQSPSYAEKAHDLLRALERVASIEGIDVLVDDLQSIRADARYVGDIGLLAAKRLRDVYVSAEQEGLRGFQPRAQMKLKTAAQIMDRAVSICEEKLEAERAARGS